MRGVRHNARKEVRATANVVVDEGVSSFLGAEVLDGVCPEDVAHQTVSRWFTETIKGANIVKGLKLGGEAAMDT